MLTNILIILVLIVLNGFFAMAELAIVSSRRAKLQVMLENGHHGAKVALELAENPTRLMSLTQIGITLIGILSGTYSGATIAEPVGRWLSTIAWIDDSGPELGITLVVICVTYVSLIIGELVPKQLALRHAEGIACNIAGLMRGLAWVATPIVFFLERSNKIVLKLFRMADVNQQVVSHEELKAVIAESTESGVFEPEEKNLLERVMRLDDIKVASVMTHRQNAVWVDKSATTEAILEKVRSTRHSRYLVCDGDIENVLGFVVIKDLLLQLSESGELDVTSYIQPLVTLPDTASILETLQHFKQFSGNMVMVVDEYGSLEGVATLKDVMGAIVGTLPEPAHRDNYTAVQRQDGSWLLDGMLSVHDAEETLGTKGMADEDEHYNTLAGFVLHQLRDIPKEGDFLDWQGLRFEIMDMDGNRIDKILAQKV